MVRRNSAVGLDMTEKHVVLEIDAVHGTVDIDG